MKKILIATSYLLIALFFATTLSGCAKKTTSGGNIVVWSFEDADSWKPIIKEFEKQYKGFKLVYKQETLDDQYENRVLNSVISGSGPDVWAMPNDWVYRHKEKLVPMPDTLAKTVNMDKDYVPSIKQSVVIKDKIYALSPSAEPLMIYYNPKVFSDSLKTFAEQNKGNSEAIKQANALLSGNSLPKTWTEFTSASNLMTKKNGEQIEISGTALGTPSIQNSEDILYLLMLQNQTKVVSDDFKLATFNLPKDTSTGDTDTPGKRALEFYTSFSNPSSENYSWNDSMGNEIEAFANGKVGMILGYSDLQNTLLQKYPNFKYKKAFAPQLEQDSEKIVDFARFNAFGVSRLSKNPSAGWGVISAIVKSSDDFSSASKLYTSKKANSYDITIKARTSSNPEKLSLATAQSLVKGRYPQEFNSLIKTAIANVNSGSQDPQSALDLAANKITELMRKDDW